MKGVSLAVGTNETLVRDIIVRGTNPGAAKLQLLAQHLGCTVDALFVMPDAAQGAAPSADPGAIGAAAGGFPVRYRAAAAFGAVDEYVIPKAEQELYPRPARWRGPDLCFGAEVMDLSADRFYTPGTMLICAAPDDLDRPLKSGDKCLVAQYVTDQRTGDLMDIRVLVLTLARYSHDLILEAPTSQRQHKLNLTIEREAPGPGSTAEAAGARYQGATEAPAHDYLPHPGDTAEILGVVVAGFFEE